MKKTRLRSAAGDSGGTTGRKTSRARRALEAIECRSDIDNALLQGKSTWGQVETGADAAWWGIWAEPFQRIIVTYAEGDVDQVTCANDREFEGELREVQRFALEHNSWKGIDTNSEPTARRFADAGLSDLLYPERLKSLQESRGPEATACAAG